MLEFRCPHCKELLRIPVQFIGTTGTCRKCGNKITIEEQAAPDTASGPPAFGKRPPVLVAFHCEATGTSSRKCNIVELGGIKFDLNGREIDQFWSFANPGHLIMPKITDVTGITDDMVAGSPLSLDVVKQWFDWIGPNALLFSDHALFDTKFVCATLLKDDVAPPPSYVIDILAWARKLEVPVKEYKLRHLLDHVGARVSKNHRALESCHGVVAVAAWLAKRQSGAHLETDNSLAGRLLGKKTETINEESAYRHLASLAKSLQDVCGEDFYEKVRYEARLERAQSVGAARGGAPTAVDAGGDYAGMKHRGQWYQELRGFIEGATREQRRGGVEITEEIPQSGPWENYILEASLSTDRDEQKRLCKQALAAGARDPWPYERLTNLYIRDHDYDAAQKVCELYFESGTWKAPRWAETSLKLLERLEKIERKLAKSHRGGGDN